MNVTVFDTPEQVGKACALLFASQVMRKKNSVLGLATGSSPIGCYQQLIAWHREGWLDFSDCISYNLDEYVGLPIEHETSYHAFMQAELFSGINMKATYLPDGNAANMNAECRRYDRAIEKAGGIDIQLLGIGRNGHIGFNEPGEKFIYGTHVVNLTESTIDANKRFFESADQVPRQAVSLGIGGIMNAREVVLVAMGVDKAKAIADTVKGPITPMVQASILRTHPNAHILIDKAAASRL